MPKEINCDKCNTLVAVLEKGSKWKTGSTALCPKCSEEIAKKAFAEALKNVGNPDPFTNGTTDNLFGQKMDSFMGGLFGGK